MRILTVLLMALISTAEIRVKAELSGPKSFMCESSAMNQKTLLSGCVWIRHQKNENLKTLHAEISSQQADFYVEVKDQKIYYFNHRGLLNLKLRDGQKVILPAGFFVWISEINLNKKNETGVISPIEKSHILSLFSLWEGDDKPLKAQLNDYRRTWGSNNELAADYYKSLVDRRLASIETEKLKKLTQQERAIRARQKQQKMLFDRTFNR